MSAGAKLGREAVWLGVGQALSSLGGLVAVKVLTGVYEPSIYGEAWLLINGVAIAVGLSAKPLAESLNRFFHDSKEQSQLDQLLALIWRLQLGTTVVAGGLYLAIAYAVNALSGPAWISYAILPLYFFCSSLFSIADLLLNTSRRRGARVLLTVAEAWLRPGFAILIGMLWRKDINAFVLGYAAGDVVAGIWGGLMTSRYGSVVPWKLPAPDRALVRDILGYALPWAIVMVCAWTMTMADRYALKFMREAGEVGIYVAAYQVGAAPFQIVNVIFGSLVQPLLFRHGAATKAAGAESMTASFGLFLWMGLPMLAAFLVFREWLMRLLSGPAYWPGMASLPWIGLGIFFLTVGDQARNAFLIAKKTRAFLSINVTAAIVNILLNVILIGPLGIMGAGIACTITFAIYAAGAIYWGRRIIPWKLPIGTLASAGLIAAAAAGASIALHRLALNGRYDLFSGIIVSGAFMGVLAIGLWWRRKEILQAIHPFTAMEA